MKRIATGRRGDPGRADVREHRSVPAAPARVRLVLSAAFLVTAGGLAFTSVLPLAAISAELRNLIALGDDHVQAVDEIANLRGQLSDVRMRLVRIAAADPWQSTTDLDQAFARIEAVVSGLDRFADTSFEQRGFSELRGAIARSAARAGRVRAEDAAGRRSSALAALPGALAEMADADSIAQGLVRFNARQVQASAREIRASLWRIAGLSTVLGALGLGAALVLLHLARSAFARYSTSIEARASEMGAFAGRAAHELRTPLQTVALAIAALRARPGEERALHRADRALRRVQGTVDALLAFASAGGTPGANATCEVAPVVDEVVAELDGSRHGEGLAVARAIDPTLTVGMDAAHLGAVISNLLLNAAKYARTDAGVRVEISALRRDERWAEIVVADHGPGIPPGALPHVFEPLYRASASPDGHGLGLATTKRLVEAYGGEIAVDSSAGRGTSIRLWLPAPAPKSAGAAPAWAGPAEPHRARPDGSRAL